MKLFICPNLKDDFRRDLSVKTVKILEDRFKFECSMSREKSMELYGNESYVSSVDDCDYVVSVGGDGTVLRATQIAIKADKPLFGINCGRLGYLCAIDFNDLSSIDSDFISALKPTKRSLLSTKINGKRFDVLNDFVIGKNSFGATITLSLWNENIGEINLRGDGVVIATPTGSTAYSYAAGGPTMDYGVNATLITTICPHQGSDRSIVISDKNPINVSLKDHTENTAFVYADGENVGEIDGSAVIKIERSKKHLILLSSKK